MTCNKCGTANAPLKRCCSSCGAFLEGRVINNVTGEVGYRNTDGSFTPECAKNTEQQLQPDKS